ncbi:hypothetical protein KL86DPRO_11564 [uncultured delta proteobacterium]|uniref:Uncharacterized protein n=1 Tax=uncultured delta proteobacterium TaxID=34034 RepID=A0A212JIP5_9DELT|nr:hypothetical protein KL86DPRO_11564 [uncultured delta proteobacterium]
MQKNIAHLMCAYRVRCPVFLQSSLLSLAARVELAKIIHIFPKKISCRRGPHAAKRLSYRYYLVRDHHVPQYSG